MECDGFLGRPQQHLRSIKLVSWNVNGVKSKLENNRVQDPTACVPSWICVLFEYQ